MKNRKQSIFDDQILNISAIKEVRCDNPLDSFDERCIKNMKKCKSNLNIERNIKNERIKLKESVSNENYTKKFTEQPESMDTDKNLIQYDLFESGKKLEPKKRYSLREFNLDLDTKYIHDEYFEQRPSVSLSTLEILLPFFCIRNKKNVSKYNIGVKYLEEEMNISYILNSINQYHKLKENVLDKEKFNVFEALYGLHSNSPQ